MKPSSGAGGGGGVLLIKFEYSITRILQYNLLAAFHEYKQKYI